MDVAGLSRWIEDKVAPAPLLAVQALANSHESEDESEKLTDPAAAREWLAGYGLLAPDVELTESDLDEIRGLRRCVRALIDANMTGAQDAAANAELARIADRHPVAVRVGADGSVGLDLAPAPSVDALIAQVIGIVMRAQVDGTWERLKICAADTCRWAFYDASKNRRGHWCSMEVCGNREKNRAYRARHAASS